MRLNEVINHWVRNKSLEKELRLGQEEPETAPEPLARGAEESAPPRLEGRDVPGLNINKAITRFGGETGYIEILRSYVVHTPSLLDQLKTYTGETLAKYAITVHGVKGSSYGICAEEVGKLAEELELAAKAGDLAFVEAHTEPFTLRVQTLLTNLTGLLQALDGENQKPLKPEPDPELLARIREAAEHYNIGELDIVMAELESYDYESRQDLVPWLREQINKSEFELVQKRLEE
jgi:HPt (histidine-containing phosphotransfer) domain-containing protein